MDSKEKKLTLISPFDNDITLLHYHLKYLQQQEILSRQWAERMVTSLTASLDVLIASNLPHSEHASRKNSCPSTRSATTSSSVITVHASSYKEIGVSMLTPEGNEGHGRDGGRRFDETHEQV